MKNSPAEAQFPFLFSVFVAVTKLLSVKLIYKKYKCLEGHPYQVIPIYVYLFHRFYSSLNCQPIRINFYRFGPGQKHIWTELMVLCMGSPLPETFTPILRKTVLRK